MGFINPGSTLLVDISLYKWCDLKSRIHPLGSWKWWKFLSRIQNMNPVATWCFVIRSPERRRNGHPADISAVVCNFQPEDCLRNEGLYCQEFHFWFIRMHTYIRSHAMSCYLMILHAWFHDHKIDWSSWDVFNFNTLSQVESPKLPPVAGCTLRPTFWKKGTDLRITWLWESIVLSSGCEKKTCFFLSSNGKDGTELDWVNEFSSCYSIGRFSSQRVFLLVWP